MTVRERITVFFLLGLLLLGALVKWYRSGSQSLPPLAVPPPTIQLPTENSQSYGDE